ncbi:MAG: hypothetical protein Ct9H300mP8_00690 [Gammaproteobacteria bacterium]|nr:MAG: hypothetical protein Ct9H300mP8_00690 [Gammaproteobacteria bacterium]
MELRVLPVTGLPMIQEGDVFSAPDQKPKLQDNQQLLEQAM